MKQLRLKLTACAVALLVVLASALALLSTSAVSAAMPGRIGAPAITTPVPSRTVADQPVHRLAVLGDVGTGEMDELRVAARVADLGPPTASMHWSCSATTCTPTATLNASTPPFSGHFNRCSTGVPTCLPCSATTMKGMQPNRWLL